MLAALSSLPGAIEAVSAAGLEHAPPSTQGGDANRFVLEAEQRREAIEREQRQRQLLRQPSQAPARPTQQPSEPPAPEAEQPEAPCWYLTGVSLAGNRIIADEQLRQAIAAHSTPCLTPGQINRLLAAITHLYTTAGYVASRPFLLAPPADGQPLQLAIEEGFVEAIELIDRDLPVSLSAAFPGMLGEPLQLRSLERGLDQLNRLRSVDLTADIEPGDLPGGSRIVLRALSHPRRWQLTAGHDTGGTASTGRNRSDLSLAVDSPLERNDFFSLHTGRSHAGGPSGSDSLGLYYSIPYGPWTLALSANRFRYRAVTEGLAGAIDQGGTSTMVGAAVERALWRDQHRLLSASLRLDDKQAEGLVQKQRISVQSPHYQSLEGGLNALWLGDATWAGYLGYSHGLGGWTSNDGLRYKQPGAQTARFGRWRTSVSRTAHFTWAGLRWTHHSSLHAQYSAQRTPLFEALSLANSSQVRGFRLAAESTSGAAWRNTLYLPFSLGAPLRLTPSLGIDAGWADGRHAQRGDRLLGASLGLAFEHTHASLGAEYQRSLYRRNAPTEPGYWQLAMQLRF